MAFGNSQKFVDKKNKRMWRFSKNQKKISLWQLFLAGFDLTFFVHFNFEHKDFKTVCVKF